MGNTLSNTYLIGDNIISSLGFTTQENIDALTSYRSGISPQEAGVISDDAILAGMICNKRLQALAAQHQLEAFSKVEQLIILSIKDTLSQAEITCDDPSFGIILSTTKGNIDLLHNNTKHPTEKVLLGHTASQIASYFQIGDRISVVSNACISGVSALVVADCLLQAGTYRHVVVVGVDVLSHFISSGFLSFKSISESICKPYDAQHDGLSLGEACGSILLTTEHSRNAVILRGGAISNDANHISGPSRTGDGLFYALEEAMQQADVKPCDIDFINLHGTATVYNDEMEAKAIHLAQLQNSPINSLKPYFGHTLGASGVIETVICIHELKGKQLYGTLGYTESGTSLPLNVTSKHQQLQKSKTCIKTASGFGGCNAAIVLSLLENTRVKETSKPIAFKEIGSCLIENNKVELNNTIVFSSENTDFAQFIREAYKNLDESNPKFYKMDDQCKLGYIASSYLLENHSYDSREIGIILANRSSSLDTDIKHQQTIDTTLVGSPAIFVYTLPNIATGEICIRHNIQGENTFFIQTDYDKNKLQKYAHLAMQESDLRLCIYGWCEYYNNEYKAEFRLIETKK